MSRIKTCRLTNLAIPQWIWIRVEDLNLGSLSQSQPSLPLNEPGMK